MRNNSKLITQIVGNLMQYVGIALVPLFIAHALWKYRSNNIITTVKTAFSKKPTYGPREPELFEEWKQFRRDVKYERQLMRKSWLHHIALSLTGGYRRGKPKL